MWEHLVKAGPVAIFDGVAVYIVFKYMRDFFKLSQTNNSQKINLIEGNGHFKKKVIEDGDRSNKVFKYIYLISAFVLIMVSLFMLLGQNKKQKESSGDKTSKNFASSLIQVSNNTNIERTPIRYFIKEKT